MALECPRQKFLATSIASRPLTFRQRLGEKCDNVEQGLRDMTVSLDVHSGLLGEELIFLPGAARYRCRVNTIFAPSRFSEITKL